MRRVPELRRLRVAATGMLILALTLSAAGCGGDTTSTSTASPSFTLQEPAFSVTFPAEPKKQTRAVPQVPGASLIAYQHQLPDKTGLLVGYIGYPQSAQLADPTTVLNGARDGSLAAVPGGKLVSSSPTTVGGKPAVDAVATVRGGNYRSRLILDGRRLYQLVTAGPGDVAALHETFVSSFTLK